MIRMTALAAESMMPATMSPTASSILSPSFSAALPLMSAVMTCHIKAATDGSVPTPDRMHRTAYTLMMSGIFLTSVALGTLGSSSFRFIQNLSRFVSGYKDTPPTCQKTGRTSQLQLCNPQRWTRRPSGGVGACARQTDKMFGRKTDYKVGGLLKSAAHARECLSCRAYNRAGNAK